MDLEILESLALGADRPAALAQLLPGSEDYDYFRALHTQQAGHLDEVDQLLAAWPGRHGQTERYQRMRRRQLLCRLGQDPARAADLVRDEFGVDHGHQAEVDEAAPDRPSRLPDHGFDGAALLAEAVARGSDLSQVTDDGLYQLLASTPLDATRRRVLLDRLLHTPDPALVAAVAADLAERNSNGFGSLRIHGQLTTDQLVALAAARPELRTHQAWIAAVILHMRPPSTVDLDQDLDARLAYVAALWAFVATLPPTSASLQVHVLLHLLDTQRRRGAGSIDLELFATYVRLPRRATYASRAWLDRQRGEDIAQLGVDFSATTGLPGTPDDDELVRDTLHHHPGLGARLADHFERAWLDAELATAHLLAGASADEDDRATMTLGPARAAALRDRIDLAWCRHDPARYAADAPVVLDADIKNVPELVIKVFRVDPIAYFQNTRREVDTDLDLDGLAASHELSLRFTEAPIRRVRRRIELPMCARAGTYVVDLIGNGMSSRAIVRKGRLRYASRIGAQGHVVTIVDDTGAPRPDARAIVGDREYAPDERGSFVVPFSTQPQRTPMLLFAGDIATVQHLDLVRETYALGLRVALDREGLAAGRAARAIARITLTVAGAPASVALLTGAMWDVTLHDRWGVSTTRSQPLVLDDTDAAVLDWPMGDDTASIAIGVRARVRVASEQREEELTAATWIEVATMHAAPATEALYLAHTSAGWVVSALGKSGEPRARRPVTVNLVHRWTTLQRDVELATDERGRIELGALAGIVRITATLPAATQTWQLGDAAMAQHAMSTAAGTELVVPIAPTRDAGDVISRMSLVEVRADVPVRHVAVAPRALAGGVALSGLAPGDYWLRAPGIGHIGISVVEGAAVGTNVVAPTTVVGLSRALPVIAAIDASRVVIHGATPATRVHVIATRFAPSPIAPGVLGRVRSAAVRQDRARSTSYVSGRELGDEYRYILERRGAPRSPGLLLERPSLLLNPWSRRTTTTDVAAPRPPSMFAPSAGPQASGYGGSAPRQEMSAGTSVAWASHDFLPDAPVVLANLTVDDHGVVALPSSLSGGATYVTVVVDDPAGTTTRGLALAEPALVPRDQRLRVALDPARHATQQKAITPMRAGGSLVVDDLATATIHLVDSVERAHGYLLALSGDATLREFAFVARWHAIGELERLELYGKYACHELHLFLHAKDRAFFDRVVRGYLANKRVKTFVDHWLLGADLAPYLEPARLAKLNAVERALLARALPAANQLARQLADQVAVQPPDPARDTRLIDTLLGASAMDTEGGIAVAKSAAFDKADSAADSMMIFGAASVSDAPATLSRSAPPRPAKKEKKESPRRSRSATMSGADASLDDDFEERNAAAPMFRAQDTTQEWAETNWWRRSPADSTAAMIGASALWRDVAAGVTLSPHLGLATGNFAETMCALALTELPFIAGAHAYVPDGPRLTITVASDALAGSSQLVDGELVGGGAPLVVGASFVRADDRHDYVDGEQVDKYVTGPMSIGVVYTCRVVVANPTSARQRVAALVQIPRGSVPVEASRRTNTVDIRLEPYGTEGIEYSFYFPQPGTWGHFPAHVTRAGTDDRTAPPFGAADRRAQVPTIVAATAAVPLIVVEGGQAIDPASWPYVSQRGSLAQVVATLATANLSAIDLDKIAWRMKDRTAYDAILAALDARRTYHASLWGYALLHRERARIATWLRAQPGHALLAAGPVLDGVYDSEDLGIYEHLELSPLTNARAHRLGPKLRILNDGLAAQYRRFLDLVAHRAEPSDEDLLAYAGYLLAQDRGDAAHAALARVRVDGVADRMQHDYLAAFAACLAGDVARARALAAPWRDPARLAVERWRRRFEAMIAMLDEVAGVGMAPVIDVDSRGQQQGDLAARQPTFELAVDRDGVRVRQQNVGALELRYFEMDVELLFSRQPFVASDLSRLSYIEPGHRESLVAPGPEVRVPWQAALRGKNVVVEAVAAGQRRAVVHYANDLATTLAHQYGQVRAQRASDGAALPATYVKVYVRTRAGAVEYYKDGYTDLRGWFDYATLSTTTLDTVDRFALLVCSDTAGAAILETTPPAR